MAHLESKNELPGEVSVHLLDPSLSRPLQSWKFAGRDSISIGRGPEREVALSDPYVSRLHAEVRHADGRWVLLAHGRHGVLVQNEPVQEMFVSGDVTFKLGSSGPTLRFQSTAAEQDNRHTLCFDSAPIELFSLDATKLARDVSEITQADYFHTLQQRAQELRRQRSRS